MAKSVEKDNIMAPKDRRVFYHLIIAILGFADVAVGAYALVQSVIILSGVLKVSEYLISFFIVTIGTSLPEFVVDLTASHTKQYELATGDITGSSLVDASLSLGIEHLLFPTKITGELATIMGLCALFGSFLVILTLSLAKRVDRKVRAFFITIYLFFYKTRYVIRVIRFCKKHIRYAIRNILYVKRWRERTKKRNR